MRFWLQHIITNVLLRPVLCDVTCDVALPTTASFLSIYLSIYLSTLSQPRKEDIRTGAQRHRAKEKERIKSKIGKVKKLKVIMVTEEAKNS